MAASKKSKKKAGTKVQKKAKASRAAGKPSSRGSKHAPKAKKAGTKGKPSIKKSGSAKRPSGAKSKKPAAAKQAKADSAKKAQLAKQRERALAQKAKEKQAKQKAEQLARAAAKEKQREKKLAEQERARLKREAAVEKARLVRERDKAQKDALREKERLRKEKEAEKERLRKEKERILREKEREKERLRKEKEREAYRRAREAERERVRTEREAARRALEGRVAQQAKEAQRISGLSRGGSTRVYRPDAIPSQSGTTREGTTTARGVHRPPPVRTPLRPPAPPAVPRPAPPADPETRWATIRQRIDKMPERFRREYSESFDMSWIHHDSALEGVVYTFQELKTAIDANIVIVPDSSLQPVCEEIRRHKQAIEWARDLGTSDLPLTAEVLKKLYLLLHPEEGDLKSVKYRKEIPQHRLYFHEYAAPDKIAVRIRQAFEWLHGPEPPKLKDPVRVAARLHFDLLRTFPFPEDSGKVARLLMNVILMRAGLPPVIIHSTERQRYYDALRGSLPTIVHMVGESMKNSLASIEKVLDEEGLAPTG